MKALLTSGRLAVFARGPDGALGRIWQLTPNGAWSTWDELGAVIRGAPTAVQNADGRLELFAVGPQGHLGNMWQETGVGGWWSGWSVLGPAIRSDPVAFQNADGRLELFAIGPHGLLGHMWQLPEGESGWSSWEDFGPTIRSAPSVFQNADGRLELFAIGADGLLGHVWQPEPNGLTGWSSWEDLGPAISGPPAVFQNADGRLELFAVGPDGLLGHTWQLEPGGVSGWSDWESLGAAIQGDPVLFQNADGRLEVFAAGPDARLGHLWQPRPGDGRGWSSWEGLGPAVRGSPAVFQNADGRLEVFAAGSSGVLGHMWQTREGRGWSHWEELGPALVEGRIAVCQASDRGIINRDLLSRVERQAASSWPLLMPGAISADVCVIGAGPAGITVSDGLVRAGASVVLLESGGWAENPVAEELNRGIADGPLLKGYPRYLTDARRRQVQGAASGWGPGWCMPFRSIDFEARPWVACSGWPLTLSELAPYEALAAETFGFDAFGAPRPDGSLVRVSYHYPPDPQLFRTKFLNLLTQPRFRVEFDTTALELHASGDRIRSVRCARLGGGELRVAADTVVVAAGGIENARLLLLNEHALPGGEGMIGRCFMEHPHILAGGAWLPSGEALRSCLDTGPELDVLALADAAQSEERVLNASVQLRQTNGDESADDPIECELYVRAEQAPNPESRVLLGERLDRVRCPQPVLHWRLLEQDWESIVRTATLVASALEQGYDAMTELSISSDEAWPGDPVGPGESTLATWGYHHMGTTRMADEPAKGVVDRDCRVHGMANLYLAGSSVFPTGGCANPTFTIVALAHRLVDHLSVRPSAGAAFVRGDAKPT